MHAAGQLLSEALLLEGAEPAQIDKILAAKDDMLDAMGVYQHHDAISGTAKQHVANDYMDTLSVAMEANNDVYQAEIARQMWRDTGLKADKDMSTCVNNHNSTSYLSCPIGSNVDKTTAMIAVHNPRYQAAELVSFLVPPEWKDASVEAWTQVNDTYADFIPVESQAVYANYLQPGSDDSTNRTLVEQYEIYADVELSPMALTYVRLNRSSSVPKPEFINDDKNLIEVLPGATTDLRYLNFTYIENNDWNSTQDFSINLGMYLASDGKDGYTDNDNSPEGAYLLKPKKGSVQM